jgi:hypothetical protein
MDAYEIGTPCRRVFFVEDDNVVDVMARLLINGAGILKEHIPYDAVQDFPTGVDDLWDIEKANWLSSLDLTNVVTEPTTLVSGLNEICLQTGITLWWDAERKHVSLNASILKLGDDPRHVINDSMIIADTLSIVTTRQLVLTQAWWWHNKRNILEGPEPSNFDDVAVVVADDLESDNAVGRQSILSVYANWLSAGQTANAIALARRKLLQRSLPRWRIKFSALPAAIGADLFPGSFFILESQVLQGADGQVRRTRCQISEIVPTLDGLINVVALTQEAAIPAGQRFGRVGPDSLLDYDSETDENKALYAWILTTDAVVFADDGSAYLLI